LNLLRRRQFLAAAAALFAAPIVVRAEQNSGKAARIGYLTGRELDFERLWPRPSGRGCATSVTSRVKALIPAAVTLNMSRARG
jgi:hypothetical protein